MQSRIKRAFKRAGPDAQPVPGALIHGLRHTYATELANADVSVYTLMKLLGHESMTTSQRYVAAAGAETRTAAAQNPLYSLIPSKDDNHKKSRDPTIAGDLALARPLYRLGLTTIPGSRWPPASRQRMGQRLARQI